MDYAVNNPLLDVTIPQPPKTSTRFAGEKDIQSSIGTDSGNRSKYLSQGKDLAEEQRKKVQSALDSQVAAESGRNIDFGDYGSFRVV